MSGTVLFRRPPRKHRRFTLLGEVKIQDQDRVLYIIALPRLNQKVQYIGMYIYYPHGQYPIHRWRWKNSVAPLTSFISAWSVQETDQA